MTDETLSAKVVFKSLEKKMNAFDNEKIKTDFKDVINAQKTTGNVDFTKTASKMCKPKWLEFFLNLIFDFLENDNKYGRLIAAHIFQKLCPVLSLDHIINLLSFVIEFKDTVDSDVGDEDILSDSEDINMENTDEENENENNMVNISSLESVKEEMMASSETADIDLDDVPAEELKHFDKRLEKLMKAQGKLPTAEEKEIKRRELATRNIRYRGCDLIKVLVKTAVNPNHLIILVVPLYKLIQSNTESEEFRQIFCKIYEDLVVVETFKQTEDSMNILVGKEIKKLLYFSSEKNATLQNKGLRFLIKICQNAHRKNTNTNDLKPIFEAVSQALVDLFTVKNCPVNLKVFNIPLSLMKDDFIPICNIIRKYAFIKSSKSFKKISALHLLITAYEQRLLLRTIPLEELKDFQVTVSSNMVKILKSTRIQSNYMIDFFLLMKSIYMFHNKECDCKIGFNWDIVKSAMKAFSARNHKKLSYSVRRSFRNTTKTIELKNSQITSKKKSPRPPIKTE